MLIKPRNISLLPVLGTLVLIVASLYWARAVLMPVALAILLTFLLSPVDNALQRLGLGRVFSVMLLAALTLSLIGAIGWAVTVQIKGLANDLPGYQANIKERVEDLQIGKGTKLDNVRTAFKLLLGEEDVTASPSEIAIHPVRVTVQSGRPSLPAWSHLVLPLLSELLQILLVVMLVIFMLLERDELRKRVIHLLGYGRLSLTNTALDEAGHRVSRYLFAQFIVNVCLGVTIGLGLFLLGVPYALLWGFLIIILRFVPYIGIWITALLTFAVSLATSPSWWQPLSVLGMFAVVEVAVSMIVEPMLFSRSAGTSKLAMLIAIAFWTWLWGPVGLLLATPLTACLTVIAKNVPQLEFIGVLFSDQPMMKASVAYYQRLLATDLDAAESLIAEELRTHPVEHVFEQVLVPALHYTKRDRQLGKLTDEEEAFVYKSTRQIIKRIGLPATRPALSPDVPVRDTATIRPDRIHILAWPAHDEGDAIALLMLQQLLDPARYEVEICDAGKHLSAILREVEQKTPVLFCIGFVPPGGLSACRLLNQLLRRRLPELNIVVGHWGLHANIHNDRESLLASGATVVAASLAETRDRIAQALHPHGTAQPEPSSALPSST